MNSRWLLIRRLRWPAYLVLFGITALLNEYGSLSFGQSWPLYLVLAGVLTLAERAAFVQGDPSQMPPQYPPYGSGGYPPPPPPSGWAPQPPPAQPGTGIVPAPPSEIERSQGGQ